MDCWRRKMKAPIAKPIPILVPSASTGRSARVDEKIENEATNKQLGKNAVKETSDSKLNSDSKLTSLHVGNLLANGKITEEQFYRFLSSGLIGVNDNNKSSPINVSGETLSTANDSAPAFPRSKTLFPEDFIENDYVDIDDL